MARRHRLCAAARRSGEVARGRQSRLRRDSARSQGAAIDGDLAPGERVGPLVVLGVPGKSPGEVAFHWPERRILIVGDAIIGNPPGACGFLREKVMDDPPRLRASVRELLALDFDVLLVGDGTSILSGAKERVAALCASVPS